MSKIDSLLKIMNQLSASDTTTAEQENGTARPLKTRVLIVAYSTSLRRYLKPIFKREGYELEVCSDLKDIQRAIHKKPFDQVLVSRDKANEFSGWLKNGDLLSLHGDFSAYSTICHTLLENPVPYHRITHSFFRSLQLVAEARGKTNEVPPYHAIGDDIVKLARAFGFRRLAADGIRVASCLLTPEIATSPALRFADFERSIADAEALDFPWNVRGVLESLEELLKRGVDTRSTASNDKLSLAAQIVAIVWYRHVVVPQARVDLRNKNAIRRKLETKTTDLWSTDVVETYGRLLSKSGDPRPTRNLTSSASRNRTSRETIEQRSSGANDFSANLALLSFTDLIQALSQSRKSVRIRLTGPGRQTATVYLERGRMVHAVCGDETGEGAVYQVLHWGEDGEFTIEPIDQFPRPNITESNESILMEGCRLLDESRV